MKTFLRILVPALALGLTATSIIHAEDDAGPPPGLPPANQPPPRVGRGGRGGMMDPAQRIQQLDAALKLTDDQKAKIAAIFQKDQEQMQALRGGSTPRDQMMAKGQEIAKASHDQIRALLTEDQQKKFDAMPMPPGPGGRGAGGGRRRGGAGAPPPPGDAGAPPPPPAAPAP